MLNSVCRSAVILLAAVNPALAGSEGMRVDSSCLVTVWAPDDAELAGSDRWRDDGGRLSLATEAPGGGFAIRMFSRADKPADLASYKIHVREADRKQPDFARIEAEFFIPAKTRFNVGGAKMPLGIFGGDPVAERTCATGGCPPEKQTGFSVRLTRGPVDMDRPGRHGPRIYSYHLNRDSRRVDFEDSHSKRRGNFDELQYGETFPMGTTFPLGEWFTLTIDVGLNRATADQVVSDGFADLYMHDADGALMGHVSAENLIFRDDPAWHVFGPLLADLWGGDQTLPTRMPIMDTEMYSRYYRLSLLEEGRSLGECLDPARLPAGRPAG